MLSEIFGSVKVIKKKIVNTAKNSQNFLSNLITWREIWERNFKCLWFTLLFRVQSLVYDDDEFLDKKKIMKLKFSSFSNLKNDFKILKFKFSLECFSL